jgi:hypothetical protein
MESLHILGKMVVGAVCFAAWIKLLSAICKSNFKKLPDTTDLAMYTPEECARMDAEYRARWQEPL